MNSAAFSNPKQQLAIGRALKQSEFFFAITTLRMKISIDWVRISFIFFSHAGFNKIDNWINKSKIVFVV